MRPAPSRVTGGFVLLALTAALRASAAVPDTTVVGALTAEARALRPLLRSGLARAFVDAVPRLPEPRATVAYRDSLTTRYWSEAEALRLPDSTRAALVRRELPAAFHYLTRYGSPLAYARALDVLAAAGLADVRGKRVADFGYGSIGHLRLLAELGADAHGIDVDPLLELLYASENGAVAGGPAGGRLTTHLGRWPAEEAVVAAVGEGYDLFLSKNTLKHGYIHPAEPVDPRRLVHLGVDDSTYVAALARTVRPGGWVLIYNLSPAPAPPGKPYIPWADGRCPFARALWEAAGFDVLAFDRDDSEAARAMGHALGWDAGERPMDLERDLFGTYSLFRRRRG